MGFKIVKTPKVKKERKKLNTLDKILLTCFISLIVFTLIMIGLFIEFQSVPDSLIIAFFAIFTGECGCCTYIWKSKLKNKFDRMD